jgi:DNA polymerase-4
VQDDLFDDEVDPATAPEASTAWTGDAPVTDNPAATTRSVPPTWRPGQDVEHTDYGQGWVWGSGAGLVTVRFEHRTSPPGPVYTFAVDDPALAACDPLPLRRSPPA